MSAQMGALTRSELNFIQPVAEPKPLMKQAVAAVLREKIIAGDIAPGELIVERQWAAQLGVAQASVREALNILAAEGFILRVPGRRARATQFSKQDVEQIYEIREVLEGLAARLIVERKVDLVPIERAWDAMQRAAAASDIKALVDADLRFHLSLCEESGNALLAKQARRLLVPLFAFVLMRVYTNQRGAQPWKTTIELHGQIVDALKLGDPFVAEQYVARTTHAFAVVAYDDWESRITDAFTIPRKRNRRESPGAERAERKT
jgi:DNA-binding GntR family transcriptional regulator